MEKTLRKVELKKDNLFELLSGNFVNPYFPKMIGKTEYPSCPDFCFRKYRLLECNLNPKICKYSIKHELDNDYKFEIT